MSERRTKIIATLGPAADRPEGLEKILAAGPDVVRINLSHGSPDKQQARAERVRALAPHVAVLADLCGPKLRLGDLEEPVKAEDGSKVRFGVGGIPVGDPAMFARVSAGDPVYVADGTISLEAVEVGGDYMVCHVISGGTLHPRKGINLPRDQSGGSCLTEKDRSDVSALGLIDPDYVALSYVRHEKDIEELRTLTKVPIIAKIEKQQALDRIDAIVEASDAIMVARGDLGVEVPVERVPANQKRLIKTANLAGKPVITATQMLVSMVQNPLPTRAEVTDVANAVLDGTDCVMLSEETAVGQHPARTVEMMTRVLKETEPLLAFREGPSREDPENALAYAAAKLAEELDATAIVAPTRTGRSVRRLAAFRPRRPVLAYSRVESTTRQLQMVWGVQPKPIQVLEGEHPVAATVAAARRDLPSGSRFVLLDIAAPGARGVPSLVNAITV